MSRELSVMSEAPDQAGASIKEDSTDTLISRNVSAELTREK